MVVAIESGLPVYLVDENGIETERFNTRVSLSDRPMFPLSERRYWVRERAIGLSMDWDSNITQPFPQSSGCEFYWNLAAFERNAGRSITQIPNGEALDYLELFAWRMPITTAETFLFAKSTSAKRGTWRLRLLRHERRADIRLRLAVEEPDFLDALADTGGRHGILFQPYQPLRDEYRFAVVDGRVVAGAPCRRLDTVHDRWTRGRFAPWMADHHDALDIVPNRSKVAAYVRVARRIAKEIADERHDEPRHHRMENVHYTRTRDFVLDIGTRISDGAIVPIELNSLTYAGLYALDWARVQKAAIEAERARNSDWHRAVMGSLREQDRRWAIPLNGDDGLRRLWNTARKARRHECSRDWLYHVRSGMAADPDALLRDPAEMRATADRVAELMGAESPLFEASLPEFVLEQLRRRLNDTASQVAALERHIADRPRLDISVICPPGQLKTAANLDAAEQGA